MFNGFKQFILRGNVVDLAVGIIIGGAFQSIVQAFVKDILTPLISMVNGGGDFANGYFKINNSVFRYGDFVNAVISFLIMASVVYFLVVLPINKLIQFSRTHQKPADPTTKKCPYCLSEIPLKARRCPYCTARLRVVDKRRRKRV